MTSDTERSPNHLTFCASSPSENVTDSGELLAAATREIWGEIVLHITSAVAVGPTTSDKDRPHTRPRVLETHRGLIAWIGIFLLPIIAIAAGRVLHKTAPATEPSIAQIESIAWPPGPTSARAPSDAVPGSAAPVASLIEGLVKRLEAEPGDAKGWALLAQSYAFIGDIENGEHALARAVALGLDETELRHRVDAARAVERDTPRPPPAAAHRVRGIVALAGAMPQLPPEARLFVVARPTDGSATPVAVLAAEVSHFPFEFELGDEHSMLPGVGLSAFDELSVSVRISLTGTAMRDPSDIESAAKIVRLADPRVVELIVGSP